MAGKLGSRLLRLAILLLGSALIYQNWERLSGLQPGEGEVWLPVLLGALLGVGALFWPFLSRHPLLRGLFLLPLLLWLGLSAVILLYGRLWGSPGDFRGDTVLLPAMAREERLLLEKNLDLAILYYEENPASRFILSGGRVEQGRIYLEEGGIPAGRIFLEAEAENLEEAFRKAKEIMGEKKISFKISYILPEHQLLRGRLLASQEGYVGAVGLTPGWIFQDALGHYLEEALSLFRALLGELL